MKANELRIGNWVEEAHSGEFGQVDMVVLSIIERMSNHSYKPIPLTEEWLQRFGFKKKNFDSNYWFEKRAGDFDLITNDIGDSAFSKKFDHVFIIETIRPRIKHVHSLQNLYFALTGEELTIK